MRIKVEITKTQENLKEKLLHICSKSHVKLGHFKAFDDNFLVYCSSAEDAEKLFMNPSLDELHEEGLNPIMPPELRAKRSVIIRNVDDLIYNNDCEQIKSEIQTVNEWAIVTEVIKFKVRHGLKIVFENVKIADACLQKGLSMFYLHIPSSNIDREMFYFIKTCYKCYKVEDHMADRCPQGPNFKICSACSSNDHTWRECNSKNLRCINCSENHNSMSMKCPKRIEIMKMKREYSHDSPAVSYSGAVKQFPQPVSRGQELLGDRSAISKTFSCIFLSLLKNDECPGSFENTINELFSINDLPQLKLGSFRPPPVSVLTGNVVGSNIGAKKDSVNTPLNRTESPIREVHQKDSPCVSVTPASSDLDIGAEKDSLNIMNFEDNSLGTPLLKRDSLIKEHPQKDSSCAFVTPGSSNLENVTIFVKQGCSARRGAPLLRAWEGGSALITRDGKAVDSSEAGLICRAPPKSLATCLVTDYKVSDFEKLRKTPGRMLRNRET